MVDYANIPRDSRRVPIATKVQFKFDRFSGFISKYSANISPTGMFVVSSNPEPAGRVLDFEFRLGDDTELIKGQGEVVWVRSAADGPNRPPGMGIRFLELSEGSKELIYRIVDQCILEGGMPFDLSRASSGADRRGDLHVPPVGSMAVASPPLPDQPPLDLEPDPFPDLDLEPIKDASGNVLPWFNAAEKWATSGDPEPFPAEPAPAPAPPPPAAPPPAATEPEPFDSELFASIEPALRDVEATFGEGASSPVETPRWGVSQQPGGETGASPSEKTPHRGVSTTPGNPAQTSSVDPGEGAPEPEEETLPEPIPFPTRAPTPVPEPAPFRPLRDSVPSSPEMPIPAFALVPPEPAPAPAPPFSGEDTSDFLPKAVPPPEAPAMKPMASLAGGASATEQPRSVLPWVLLAALLAVAVAAFLLRDTLAGWIGLGGEEETASVQAPQRPERRPRPAPASPVETLSTEPAPAAPVIVEEAAPEEPLPEVVQRKPTPEPAAGPAVDVVERITWEAAEGGTAVVLWGNGAIRPDRYSRSRIDSPPRELVRLRGIRRPLAIARIPVGTGEVRQVRVGYHETAGGNELHVVIDLADPAVKVARVDHDGQRLRIHLRRG